MASVASAAAASLVPSGAHASTSAGHKLEYLSGFNNEHASEALPGALPIGQNGPQKCGYGLYAEQLNGTAFTVPRAKNQRSWLYRIRPSVMHEKFVPVEHPTLVSTFEKATLDPSQLRWFPQPLPPAASSGAAAGGAGAAASGGDKDWVDGLATMSGNGDPTTKSGLAIHVYSCNKSMVDTCMFNSDGDFLIVPQTGDLHIQTEMGYLDVSPKEIVVIQRGIRFRVCVDGPSRGYALEIFGGHLQLPDLGPIGSNGLANPRDFLYPVASYEDRDVDYVVINKFGGKLFSTVMHHSPFNVVAWHGNYCPYKYNLELFNTMNSVSYDHPDPSIYTVLTCPTDTPGVALCDFVIFPPRWMVMEKSFRPPFYHRNTMTEFMGMIWGKYDAKVGFQPGGASLHSCMTPHGPDADTFLKASNADLKPEYFSGGLAFMFETTLMLKVTPWALSAPHLDVDYYKCWQQLPRVFSPTERDVAKLAIKLHPSKDASLSSGSGHGRVFGDHVSVELGAGATGTSAKRFAGESSAASHGSHVDASASALADGKEEADHANGAGKITADAGASPGSKRKRGTA